VTTVRVQVQLKPGPRPTPPSQPARIVRLLALAHGLEQEVRRGETDLAGIARRYGLTRARVSQLQNLALLAPAIQAEIVGLQSGEVTERMVRTLSGYSIWRDQVAQWRRIRPKEMP
jgi:hypothetical protein